MNHYLRRFFTLLLPISIVTTIISLIYLQFTYGHDTLQTLPLASIFGFLSGASLAFFGAFIFFLPKNTQNTKIDLSHRKKKEPSITSQSIIQKKPKEKEKPQKPQKLEKKREEEKKITLSSNHTMMMLMDKELAFEVALCAIEEQEIGIITHSKKSKGTINMKSHEEILELHINTLTKHTSKITIISTKISKNVQYIIDYMKVKEYAFLQY